jgi:hypothetical protein
MKASTKSSIAATMIGSAVGTGAWLLGVAGLAWPAHPQIAVAVITVAAGSVAKGVWLTGDGEKDAS